MKKKARLISVILFLAVLAFRLPATLPPCGLKYWGDELIISQGTVSLFAGETPANLQWPGGTLYATLFCTYVADFSITHPQIFKELFNQHFDRFLITLSCYISEFCFDPQRQIILGRLLVLFFSSFAPLATFWLLRKNLLASMFAACICATMPVFFSYSSLLLPDTVAVAFWSLCLLFLFADTVSSRWSIVLSGACLGLALATKAIYLPVIPVAIGMLFPVSSGSLPNKLKEYALNLVLFFGSLFFCFALFVPFLLTAPLTLAKAYLGNIAVYLKLPQTDYNSSYFLSMFFGYPAGWIAGVFGLSGIIESFFHLGRRRAAWLITIFSVFLAAIFSLRSFEDRHLLPFLILISIYCGFGFQLALRIAKSRFPKVIIIIIAATLVLFQSVESLKIMRERAGKRTVGRDVSAWVCKNVSEGSVIAIPAEANHDISIAPNLLSLDRSFKMISNQGSLQDRIAYVFQYGGKKLDLVDFKDNPLLESVFGENERKDIFIYKMMRWYLSSGRYRGKTYDVMIYQDLPDASYHSLNALPLSEMLSKFQEGTLDYLIARTPMPQMASYMIFEVDDHRGDHYVIYRNSSVLTR